MENNKIAKIIELILIIVLAMGFLLYMFKVQNDKKEIQNNNHQKNVYSSVEDIIPIKK